MSGLRTVTVAIVSWNGLRHLEQCLKALREQVDPGVEWQVTVLDNGSTDGTPGWVRTHYPGVRLIESPVNLGFCAGNNRIVSACDSDAVAFLNNDTRPRADWLASLVEALGSASADVAAVSGTILDWPGERLDFAKGIMTFDGHAFQQDYHRPIHRIELPAAGSELLFACGGNTLVRREAFVDAGGFDSDYFAYLEDVDLGWRLWTRGLRVTFAPDAVVHHRSMATSDLLGLYNRGFLFERNALLTAYKNYSSEVWGRMMAPVLLTLLSRTQTMLVENNAGGALLGIDPYAGHIASTAPANPGSRATSVGMGDVIGKWQRYGPREFARRALRKLGDVLGGGGRGELPPTLTDDRTVAQLRSISHFLGHLDAAAAKRAAVQASRVRSDEEIFERFPLYLVATYPGDEALFESEAFSGWLPERPVLVRKRLDQVMEVGE